MPFHISATSLPLTVLGRRLKPLAPACIHGTVSRQVGFPMGVSASPDQERPEEVEGLVEIPELSEDASGK